MALPAQLRLLSSDTFLCFKMISHRALRMLCTSTTKYSDSTEQPALSDQDMTLYKLYRPEREIPKKRGMDLLKDSRINKGMAFGLFERQYLGIHGMLPPAFMTEEQQAYRIIHKLRQQPNDLARYIQLDGLQDRNEKLFYRVLCENVKELMPIVYTPTVGLACQNFGYIYRKPKGLYITINDNSISKIHHILSNWPEEDVRAIVVTDGERILGLGDLGCYGIGIPVGKLALYVALGGVQPKWCLPVLMDVGTNNEELLNDPFYIGLRRKRVRGEEYDQLIDNFLLACRKRFGQKVLVQFEDFANQNAYRLLEKYRNRYCTFNDDIQGTASVVVAGLLACSKYTGRPLSDEKFVFLGAGTASMGIAEMCVSQMVAEGLSKGEAYNRIYLLDIDGLITKQRKNISDLHIPYAKDLPDTKNLLEVVKKVKPSGLIGASTVYGAFSHEILHEMAKINENPIIFALSNPTNKAECTAEDAYRCTSGKVLFASGSPFSNVNYNGKIFKPGQGNNAYIFPGVALGAILFNIRHIDDETFLIAAHEVANCVTEKDFKVGRLYPRLNRIREVSVKIAVAIGEYAYEIGMAGLYPKPENMKQFVLSQIYQTTYDELIDVTYDWPAHDMKHGFPVPVSRRESVDDPASIRNIAKSAVLKQKHPNSADDETIPEWCHSKNDIKLYMLYRHERETPKKHGFEILKDSRFCKGMAFSLYERQHLGIHGLLPPAIMTEDQQAYRAILNLRKQPNDLARYVQLDSLQERDEKLYYRVICNHVKELLPIVYTPTVGLACQKYGFIYRRPKGLYITIHDNSISKIYHILSNWPEADVRVMVVTDGERILGLGDLGCYGMGIPVGKLALYVALAGVLPKWCLPVVLDVGTDNETLLKDPLYIGLRRKRVRGEDYDEFIDNFMKACTKKFGQKLLIHFEDFARQNAYRLLDRYREKYCVFNDDIQGTAAAVLAGLLACRQHTGRPLSAEKFIFLGAGAAAMGITELCISHMETEGVKRKKARSHIYLVDINGLITKNRLHMEKQHVPYAKDMPEITNLLELIKLIKPTALIGTSTTGGAFNEEIVRTMAEFNQKPIIFALSNPTKKAECTAEQAIKWTDGRVLFASGSPFENVKYNGKLFKPGQGNNSYIYPAVGMAAILFQIRHIDDNMFLIAAQEVAKSVSSDDYQCRRLYPSFSRIREVSLKIIIALGKYSYEKNMASLYPKPENVENFVRSQMYNTNYDKIVDYRYDWPEQDMVQGYPVPND